MSVYSLLVSAPHIDGVRTCLAVLCKERRFGESLTHPQLQEILGALEDHEESASLTEEIGDIKKDSSLSYRLRAGEFLSSDTGFTFFVVNQTEIFLHACSIVAEMPLTCPPVRLVSS